LRLIAYGHPENKCAHAAEHWISLASVTPRDDGMLVQLDSSWGSAELQARLLGAFNADNLMAALGALLAGGLPLDVAVKRLAAVRTVPGRMELFAQPGMPRVVVDYAHTPHALGTVLQALRPHCRGQLICLFGAGGDRDRGKRPHMGAVAERHADRVVLTSDNPRSELPDAIVDQIAAGCIHPQRAERIPDRGQAIDELIATAAADDLLLVAGKGHEEFQQIGAQRLAFSDRARVQRALRRRAE
jgi:UDP-N-acetylmuramoyl-L-alanyl-D-glutamate--2,6-diaminopimelate ligase